MTSRCEVCLSVELDMDIVAVYLFLFKCIKVRRLKESRCRGPCSEPRAISEMRLLTIYIYWGLSRELIGTYGVSFPVTGHRSGRGWLLDVLVAVGYSCWTRCYSYFP